MFKDEDTRKFMMYTIGAGFLIVLMSCITLSCVMPGNEESCRLPFLDPGEEEKDFNYEEPPEYFLEANTDYRAILYTNLGDIAIDLYEENAPVTVNNFVFLSREGYYEGVLFHRIFEDLLIQTGSRNSMNTDPEDDGFGGPGYYIDDEINWDSLDIPEKKREKLIELGYESTAGLVSKELEQYSVAMANEHQGNTNGSQFFIVTADNSDTLLESLQGKHTVFGELIGGFEIVEEIDSLRVDDTDPNAPIPKKDIIIEDVEIIQESKFDDGEGDQNLPSITNRPQDQTVKFE